MMGGLPGTKYFIKTRIDAFIFFSGGGIVQYSFPVNLSSVNDFVAVIDYSWPPINLTVFVDPTFFDGTRYVDISGNGFNPVTYGGVQKTLSPNFWLWLIRTKNNPFGSIAPPSNYIYFAFFPPGTHITIRERYTGIILGELTTRNVVEAIPWGSPHDAVVTAELPGIPGLNVWSNSPYANATENMKYLMHPFQFLSEQLMPYGGIALLYNIFSLATAFYVYLHTKSAFPTGTVLVVLGATGTLFPELKQAGYIILGFGAGAIVWRLVRQTV